MRAQTSNSHDVSTHLICIIKSLRCEVDICIFVTCFYIKSCDLCSEHMSRFREKMMEQLIICINNVFNKTHTHLDTCCNEALSQLFLSCICTLHCNMSDN